MKKKVILGALYWLINPLLYAQKRLLPFVMFKTQVKKIDEFISKWVSKPLISLIGKDRWVAFLDAKEAVLYGWLDKSGERYTMIRRFYKLVYSVLASIGIYLFLIYTNFLWLMGSMPGVDELQNPKLAQASTIVAADGTTEIGRFYAENREPVSSDKIAPVVFDALIATEDIRFEEHSGIDLRSMGGVLIGLLKGGERGGGSTITQQLAKNLYNTRKKEMHGLLYHIPGIRTVVYKSKEWITAIQLEKRFSKKEIITMYLNTVSYGNNSYGIKTAAKTFFNKEPIDLAPQEAAVLIGLQKATTYYNPIRNPERSRGRRNVVLKLMQKKGVLTPEKVDSLVQLPLVLSLNVEEEDEIEKDGFGYLKSAIAKFIDNFAKKNDLEIDLYRDGLKIVTTIDLRAQELAEESVREHMKVLQKDFELQWGDKNPWVYESGEEIPGFIEAAAKRTNYYKKLEQKYEGNLDSVNYYMNLKIPMKRFTYEGTDSTFMSHMDSLRYYKKILQCGMMSMNPYTGHIVAWVGGIDYNHFQYDHVRQAKRQPGSTFKPIVYAAAIDGPLNYSPCTTLQDKPISKTFMENGKEVTWQPKNANGMFSNANLTLRQALARSINSIAVQLTESVGYAKVVEYAKKFGISSPMQAVPSIGLGTSDVSLFEMVGAYSAFVNEGKRVEPMFIKEIQNRNGKVIEAFESEPKDVISPESAYLMQQMLRGNIDDAGGTGQRMRNYWAIFQQGGQMGGKTGTTSNNSDAWYIGFTKDLVSGVWVGGDDRSIHFKGSMGEGSRSALPIVGLFLDKIYRLNDVNYKPGPFLKPGKMTAKMQSGCSNNDVNASENRSSSDSLTLGGGGLDSLSNQSDTRNTNEYTPNSPNKRVEDPDSVRTNRGNKPITQSNTRVIEQPKDAEQGLSRREIRALRRQEKKNND
ncbi:MAG: transglycosylase domain-containing protein [Spirosomataceae bacterium]